MNGAVAGASAEKIGQGAQQDLPVGRDDLADAFGRDLVLLVDRRRCDEPLDVPLVGIDEEAH